MQWIPRIIELKSLLIPEVVYETCFCYFWEGKCLLDLNLSFINYYFWVHRPNSSIKGDEGGIFSKPSDWKFLIKIEIKTQAAQIRNTIQPSSTFIRISVPIPEVKEIIDCENIVLYWEKSEQSDWSANKLGLFQIYWNISFSWKLAI